MCPWPFVQRGVIALVGPLPLGKGGVKFIVIAFDYFTKWKEAKEPLATIMEKNITWFRWKMVVCKFGIPEECLVSLGSDRIKEDPEECLMSLGILPIAIAIHRRRRL